MPRIPQDELDRLKAEVDLPALIRAKGIELKPHGEKDLVGRCPFHDDKTPSLIVTPAKGLWLLQLLFYLGESLLQRRLLPSVGLFRIDHACGFEPARGGLEGGVKTRKTKG